MLRGRRINFVRKAVEIPGAYLGGNPLGTSALESQILVATLFLEALSLQELQYSTPHFQNSYCKPFCSVHI